MINRSFSIGAGLAILVAGLLLMGQPVAAGAGLYELEYAVISEGGGSTTSSNYSIESIISATGLEEGKQQASANYSVSSVLEQPQPPAPANSWMFY